MYAYTQSRVQSSILELFCRVDCILPNLFVGTLTRETVQAAVGTGVTADDIVAYLTNHAHPHIAHKNRVVPEVRSAMVLHSEYCFVSTDISTLICCFLKLATLSVRL